MDGALQHRRNISKTDRTRPHTSHSLFLTSTPISLTLASHPTLNLLPLHPTSTPPPTAQTHTPSANASLPTHAHTLSLHLLRFLSPPLANAGVPSSPPKVFPDCNSAHTYRSTSIQPTTLPSQIIQKAAHVGGIRRIFSQKRREVSP